MKYEFTGKTKNCFGVTLKQIRALVTIAGVVTAGDVGGWIESEKNIDQISGDAWISDNAQISGNARIYGNAWISGNARISGNAWIYGNAQISGDAWIYGDARIYGDAQIYGNAWIYGNAQISGDAQIYGDGSIFWASKVGTENGTLTVFNSKDGALTVTRGCFIGSDVEFLAKSKKVHDGKTHREYSLLIEVAKSRIECKIVK